MGVSDFPVGPTVSLVAAYLMAIEMQALAPPITKINYDILVGVLCCPNASLVSLA